MTEKSTIMPCLQNKNFSEIIIIGNAGTKRTEYFLKAAGEQNVNARLISWEHLLKSDIEKELRGAAVKIEPPSFKITGFEEMKQALKLYENALMQLDKIPCYFLNKPGAILSVLNKAGVKKLLSENEIPVTIMLKERVGSYEELMGLMEEKHCYNVFLKPVNFSGAAGVTAFRIRPGRDMEKLYTSAALKAGKLFNTKQTFIYEDEKKIREYLNALFPMEVMAERWHPKDSVDGQSYDIRVVYQFGHIAYMVVRCARGPVTNLHLNNNAKKIEVLGLSEKQIGEIENLCRGALNLFPGLNSAGVDIMLDKGSKEPRIIEINGQGDLIYQDIFDKNLIYKEQVVEMIT